MEIPLILKEMGMKNLFVLNDAQEYSRLVEAAWLRLQENPDPRLINELIGRLRLVDLAIQSVADKCNTIRCPHVLDASDQCLLSNEEAYNQLRLIRAYAKIKQVKTDLESLRDSA